eukprot:13228356-Alexandrium_andersonii.AAC.2
MGSHRWKIPARLRRTHSNADQWKHPDLRTHATRDQWAPGNMSLPLATAAPRVQGLCHQWLGGHRACIWQRCPSGSLAARAA